MGTATAKKIFKSSNNSIDNDPDKTSATAATIVPASLGDQPARVRERQWVPTHVAVSIPTLRIAEAGAGVAGIGA